MKKTSPPIMEEQPILEIGDLFKDKSLSVIGLVGDRSQAKSMTIQNIIRHIQKTAPATNLVGLQLDNETEGVLHIGSIHELSKIRNSVVFIDELKQVADPYDRRKFDKFVKVLQRIKHDNNLVILGGLPHNFNGKLSGELDAIIFKQTTLISVIQRSQLDHILKTAPNRKGRAGKDDYILSMPVNGALIYQPNMTQMWHYVEIDYIESVDTKLKNEPIIKWNK